MSHIYSTLHRVVIMIQPYHTHNKQQAGIIIIYTEERGEKLWQVQKKCANFGGNWDRPPFVWPDGHLPGDPTSIGAPIPHATPCPIDGAQLLLS